MKLTSVRIISVSFLLGMVVGLATAALLAGMQSTLGLVDNVIGIGTFFLVVGIAHLAYQRHALGEDPLKMGKLRLSSRAKILRSAIPKNWGISVKTIRPTGRLGAQFHIVQLTF